jgi:hypothetical protein
MVPAIADRVITVEGKILEFVRYIYSDRAWCTKALDFCCCPNVECGYYVLFILETAVGRAKAVQVIDVHGGFKKFVVTLLVMRTFLNLSGASITCADLRDPTAVSRFIG